MQTDKKEWRDRYINLALRERFSSAAAVEKECRQIINDALSKADAADRRHNLQPVNDFVEKFYFSNRKDDLHASTLVGYKNLHSRHFEVAF